MEIFATAITNQRDQGSIYRMFNRRKIDKINNPNGITFRVA